MSDNNQELVEVVNPASTSLSIQEYFKDIISFRQDLMKEKTDPVYIQIKDKFPYLPSKYVDDKFNQYFPIHSVEFVNRSDENLWISYTVKITVALPNGLTMSRLGSGAARKQIKQLARAKIEGGFIYDSNGQKVKVEKDPDYKLTPFDFVDNGNTEKAALTNAIKNTQERFGIGADITERVIYTPEQMKEIDENVMGCIESIINPRNKIKAKEKLASLKTPNEKVRFIDEMSEIFEEVNQFINEKLKD